MKIEGILLVFLLAGLLGAVGCSRQFYGGAAVGAAGTAGAYEYQAHEAMQELEDDFKAGKISREEYDRRKREIEERSLIK
jgi:hypothetical protein